MENQKSKSGVKTGLLMLIGGIVLFFMGAIGPTGSSSNSDGMWMAGAFLAIVGLIWAIVSKLKK